MRTRIWAIAGGLLLCLAGDALADRDRTFILATGRRDPRMYAIDLQKALRPENNNTPNAIVSKSKVALDRLDGKLLGDSANIVISEDRKTAYVVNHCATMRPIMSVEPPGGKGTISLKGLFGYSDCAETAHGNAAAAAARHAATEANLRNMSSPSSDAGLLAGSARKPTTARRRARIRAL